MGRVMGIEPECNGICVYANELLDGMPAGLVAHAHPECELHSGWKPEEENVMVMVNLGAGGRPFYGWKNVDGQSGPGIDWTQHLDGSGWILGNLENNSVDRFAAIHVIEHLRYPLEFMYRAWEYAKPGCRFDIVVPHGSDDEAWGDPTHVRPYYECSFDYFARPMHWMNPQSGYQADWDVIETTHLIDPLERKMLDEAGDDGREWLIKQSRNKIRMLHVVLAARKPARGRTVDALAEMQGDGNGPRRRILTFDQYFEANPEYHQFHMNPNHVFEDDGVTVKEQGWQWPGLSA